MREPIPHVIFDHRVGTLVKNVEVNYEAIVTYMRERGFDDERIHKTCIYFGAENTFAQSNDGEYYFLSGIYDPEADVVALFPLLATVYLDDEITDETDPTKIELLRQRLSDHWSKDYSQDILHELEHKWLSPTASPLDEQKMSSYSPVEALGRFVLEDSQRYDDDPEEVKCIEASKSDSSDFVRFEIRIPTDGKS